MNQAADQAEQAPKEAKKDISEDPSMEVLSGKEDFLDEGELVTKKKKSDKRRI